MFIDRAVIEVRSGKGGDGAIAFITSIMVDRSPNMLKCGSHLKFKSKFIN